MRAQIGELSDHRIVEVAAHTAILGGRVHARNRPSPRAAPGLAVAHPLRVPVLDLGNDLLLGEAPELVAENFVFLGERSRCMGPASISLIGARTDEMA
jgi:hypothetical protein